MVFIEETTTLFTNASKSTIRKVGAGLGLDAVAKKHHDGLKIKRPGQSTIVFEPSVFRGVISGSKR